MDANVSRAAGMAEGLPARPAEMDRPARHGAVIRVLHVGLVAFGIAAWLTAEGAEDGGGLGYWLHAYLGFAVAFFIGLRVAGGVAGRTPLAFAGWTPLSGRQWRMALADLGALLRFRVPDRPLHQGLAGLVQAFGIALFAWMAGTGILMFLFEGSHDLYEMAEEVHEVGEGLIPAFLALHVGAVLLHTLAGSPVWRRMFTFGRARPFQG